MGTESDVHVETASEVYVGTASEVYVGTAALGCPPGKARPPGPHAQIPVILSEVAARKADGNAVEGSLPSTVLSCRLRKL